MKALTSESMCATFFFNMPRSSRYVLVYLVFVALYYLFFM